MSKTCECGCGDKVKYNRKFIIGHQAKKLCTDKKHTDILIDSPVINKYELLSLLQGISPQWQYVGDGKFPLGDYCPSYWDGGQKVICFDQEMKENCLSQHGFKSIFIKSTDIDIITKIITFCNI